MGGPAAVGDTERGDAAGFSGRPAANPPALLRSLALATQEHPTDHKRLVGPDVNFGREWLITLARATGGWIGWEATTVRGIAEELAFVPLAERGVRGGSDVEIGALVNHAFDRARAAGRLGAHAVALERALGFRHAVRDAILELRVAGVSAADVRQCAEAGSPAADLPAILVEYERLLAEHHLTDPAGILRAAIEHFDREARYVLDGPVFLAPSLALRGLPGQLVERLLAHGARVLAADPVIDLTPPSRLLALRANDDRAAVRAPDAGARCSALAWAQATELPADDDPRLDHSAAAVDIFAAATPSDELREVCRRVMADGLRWDDVEIVAIDVDTYGVALDALCQQVGIGATMLHGVPLSRTRLGRALDRWLAWLEGGLPADVLREALEAGELHAPGHDVTPAALARELRALAIGWGRARYEGALAPLEEGRRAHELRRGEDEPEAAFEERRSARRRTGAALAALLRALLACTPPVPERGRDHPVRASAAALARATLGWLALVPLHGVAEEQTALRLRTRLEQVAAVDGADATFASAMAALRDALADLRAWPLVTEGRKPWSAAGGMLHLTDLVHAGATGRRRTFVVGLDADRTAGGGPEDPFLPDAPRRAIAGGTLATSQDRREESAFTLAAALAALRGRVTLSYATSGSLDGRETGPSPVLLQVWRVLRRDRALSYDALRDALRPPAAAVPARGADGRLRDGQLLDARDVWLDAMADGALLLDGEALVRAAFPGLDAGLRAAELAAAAEPTAHHGIVPHAAGVLDPTRRDGAEVSPSALEMLAACPLAWFYRYGLGLRRPDDPEYDPERWLDAAARGALLHEVFETFVRAYRGRQDEIADDAARAHILAIVDDAIARWRATVPPPGEAVLEAEAAELRRAALAFLEMERAVAERGDRGAWAHVEYAFGGGEPPGTYPLPDGRVLNVVGRADRVDALPDGSLRVIDYKTGKAGKYARSAKAAPFDGGRHLQPALYAAAIAGLLDAPVTRFEYRFPTERGENEIVSYAGEELARAREIVDGLLEHVRAGAFVPTNDAKDCTYCEYRTICRVRGERNTITSPRVEWAKDRAPVLDVYRTMRARRGGGDAQEDDE
ncbi:MAG: PD-(D/E)XK nuclease family protein [Gemmatimonadaceae bacterium]|nr:PD-(D/E)XK nuclease family protein [Gemmatimonadaceae bacterium]